MADVSSLLKWIDGEFAAASVLEWQGNKYYFIGETTRREFEKKNGIG